MRQTRVGASLRASESLSAMTGSNIEDISARILTLLPQQAGFRFLDRVREVDGSHIVGEYRFDPSLAFYQAHFPGNPVTPGVILIETMAQTAVVAMGIYLLMLEQEKNPAFDPKDYLTMFTDCSAEFLKEVPPGETVTIRGERVFWRMRKLRSTASLFLSNGDIAATATLSGMGVKRT